MNRDKAKRQVKTLLNHGLLLIIGLAWIYPFLWMISASFKDQNEFFKNKLGLIPQNPTFDLPCREVFARGQKEIEVVGPFPELVKEIAEVHKGYWNN